MHNVTVLSERNDGKFITSLHSDVHICYCSSAAKKHTKGIRCFKLTNLWDDK